MNCQSEKKKNGLQNMEVRAPILKSQKGIALVVALVMLALLGMLGAYALSTSNTELHIQINSRNSQIAFSNCNEIEAFGPNNPLVLTTIIPYVVNSYPTSTGFQRQIFSSTSTENHESPSDPALHVLGIASAAQRCHVRR